MYIGQSVNIVARVAQHQWRDFDSWAWAPCLGEDLDSVERAYIDAHLPPWNADSRTTRLRGSTLFRIPAPASDDERPLPEGWLEECEAYLSAIWTEDRVSKERMRRLREIKAGRAVRTEDFGPLPQVGDAIA